MAAFFYLGTDPEANNKNHDLLSLYYKYNTLSMAHEISENTKLTLDLKTIAIVIGGVASLILMYTTLQKDIELAKELPKPEISRTEYDLKDELVRETIMNTQKKVDEIGSKLDKIEERLFKISTKE